MIVYMIMNQETGRWLDSECCFVLKQQDGKVFNSEQSTNVALQYVENCVKLRYMLTDVIEDAVGPGLRIVVDDEIWTFKENLNTWLFGDALNGCGVNTTPNGWEYRMTCNRGAISLTEANANGYQTRNDAMIAAVKIWKEQQ